MAKEPTMQNIRMIGRRMFLNTLNTCFADLDGEPAERT